MAVRGATHGPWSAVGCGLLAVTGAALSVVLLAPEEFSAVVLIGGVMGGFTLWLSRAVPGEQRLPRTGVVDLLENATIGAGLALSLALLSALWGLAGWLLVLALVGGGVALRAWIPSGPPTSSPAPQLASWTTAELLLAWERGAAMLAAADTAEERAEVVTRRQGYLDELERRDHAGVERWLTFDPLPGSDPRRFLNDLD